MHRTQGLAVRDARSMETLVGDEERGVVSRDNAPESRNQDSVASTSLSTDTLTGEPSPRQKRDKLRRRGTISSIMCSVLPDTCYLIGLGTSINFFIM